MQLARPAFARHPRQFGRGRVFDLAGPAIPSLAIGDDLKLFTTTFLLGFLFVSVLIG